MESCLKYSAQLSGYDVRLTDHEDIMQKYQNQGSAILRLSDKTCSAINSSKKLNARCSRFCRLLTSLFASSGVS